MTDNEISSGGKPATGVPDVSGKNTLDEEEFERLSKHATVYDGLLQVVRSAYFGQIRFQYWWGNGGAMFYCYAKQYKINDPDEQGKHKANIHFSFDSLQWWGVDSPDSMRQDDQWNSWTVGGYIAANKRARVYVRFRFDLPFDDEEESNSRYFNYPG
ncbi:hypothetical protein OE648_10850 [Pseudomonas moraviensis]|uniref:hypothetical protein n=1 Tax=Pseudomonas moraviensis TaxID=321662 RepID=UPI002B2BC583|nr:hypothetical protein OE648_10850 [Pseudomonas moraviensis]